MRLLLAVGAAFLGGAAASALLSAAVVAGPSPPLSGPEATARVSRVTRSAPPDGRPIYLVELELADGTVIGAAVPCDKPKIGDAVALRRARSGEIAPTW